MRLRLGRAGDLDPDALSAALVEALPQAAAICDFAGRVELANGRWRETVGEVSRVGGEGLFGAFRTAQREGRGEGRLRTGRSDRPASVTSLVRDRFLVRVETTAGDRSEPASRLGAPIAAIVSGAPFPMALICGEDPFSAPVAQANPAFDALVGPRGPGASLAELLKPAGAQAIDPAQGPIDVVLVARPGGVAQLRLTRASDVWLAYLADVTEQAAMQQQLAQRNKMEAVGQLAGGVAHDFNNLLSAIRLRVEDLLQRHPLGDPAYESLAEIRTTVARAADLVRQLLTFSRKATVRREVLDLGETLADCEVLLRRLLRENVALVTRYAPDLPRVRMDKGQLENAVMNLVVNARDAIGQAAGGRIDLVARRVRGDEARELGLAGQTPDELALVEVADNGPGVPPELLQSIFEPFFTTKPAGEGTGLGLATVYGVVKQADGWIVAHSAPGEGARFRIFLPPYVPPLRVETPPPLEARPASRDLSGHGRILLVEDEALVRGITARLLRGRGYEVLEAHDGEAALELVKANAGAIDLMISDVIMPGMDGPALLAAAQPYLEGAPVMFVSGYAEAEVSDLLEGERNVTFLAKPLDIKTLAEQVKRRLEERRDA